MDPQEARNVIEAVDLHKSYGEVPAVVGIDLQVTAGEVVAVLGPNGAGKTTTLELLLGLRSPSAGRVTVFGLPPHHVAVRGRVGAMLQDTAAPESLTVTEMVDLVGHYYPHALPTADVVARADLLVHASKRVTQLSGGQRQRLSFAVAIVGDPDLLFLDEPTAALDVHARQAFWEQAREFARLGKTLLFSTHNLAEADLAAERVILINRGRIVHDDTPARIKSLIPGKTIELLTDATTDQLETVKGVQQVATLHDREAPGIRESSRPGLHRLRLQVAEPEPVLRAVFAAGHRVEDLTVTEASLEQAFLHLTGDQGDPATTAPRTRRH
jgi:ABC-2 type transport system ATP-binding protein